VNARRVHPANHRVEAIDGGTRSATSIDRIEIGGRAIEPEALRFIEKALLFLMLSRIT